MRVVALGEGGLDRAGLTLFGGEHPRMLRPGDHRHGQCQAQRRRFRRIAHACDQHVRVVDLGLAVVGEQGREMRVRPHAEHRDIQCRILAQLLDDKVNFEGGRTYFWKYYNKWKRYNFFKAKESSIFKKKHGCCFPRFQTFTR